MFDIGFAELLIIGVVALIVIGPERLPDAVRTASAWLNRIRRGFNDIKQEVQQELHNDAVMKDLKALKDSSEELRRETQSLGSDLKNGFTSSIDDGGNTTFAPSTENNESNEPKESPVSTRKSEGENDSSTATDRKAGD